MSLKQSYTLIAPFYDRLVERAFERARQHSLAHLQEHPQDILISGMGSGLDIPFLPITHRYTGVDITPAMLNKARKRVCTKRLNIDLKEADVMALPFSDNSFDCVLMHLILAVVPDPRLALQEAHRVLRPGGRIHIIDKFLRPGQRAPLRRLLNYVTRHIATRTNVVFETLLDSHRDLEVALDQPIAANGWFRFILLQKRGDVA